MKDRNSSFIRELEKLKELRDEEVLSEEEFQLAKNKILKEDPLFKEESEEKTEKQGGLSRKATFYDALVPIILIISVVALQGGILEGMIIGAILGMISYLITKIIKSTVGRILTLIFSAILVTSVGFFFFNNKDSTQTTQANVCTEAQITEFTKILETENHTNEAINWLTINTDCAIEFYGEDLYKQTLIDLCQRKAWEDYNRQWLGYCEVNKIKTYKDKNGDKTCNIPVNQANEYEKLLQDAKNSCIIRYK